MWLMSSSRCDLWKVVNWVGGGTRLFDQTRLTCLSCWTNQLKPNETNWNQLRPIETNWVAERDFLIKLDLLELLDKPLARDFRLSFSTFSVCLTVCTECHLSTCKWSQLWSKILQNNSTPCHNIAKQWTSPCHPLNLGHDDPTVYFDLHPAVHHIVPNLSLSSEKIPSKTEVAPPPLWAF